MCGLAGLWSPRGEAAQLLGQAERMADTLGHRGPDDSGTWQDDALFYRRTLSLGRLKFYARKGLIPDATIISA